MCYNGTVVTRHSPKEKGRHEELSGWVSLFGGEFLLPAATAYLESRRVGRLSVATIFDIPSNRFGKL